MRLSVVVSSFLLLSEVGSVHSTSSKNQSNDGSLNKSESRGCRLYASKKTKNGMSSSHDHGGDEIVSRTSLLDTSEFNLKECIFLDPDGKPSKVPRGEFELQLSAEMEPVTFVLTPDNTGELEHSTFASHGHSLWQSGVESAENGGKFSNGLANMVIGEDGKTMAGSVQMGGKMFQILSMEDGTTNVVEIDLGDLPETEVDSVLDPLENAIEHGGDVGSSDVDSADLPSSRALSTPREQSEERALSGDRTFIDVLVPYTKRAVCQLALSTSTTRCVMTPSRLAAMEARIDLAMYESNVALANSGIPGRFRLAHAFLVDEDFDEVGMKYSDIIRNAAYSSDGVIDEIPEMREEHGADVVALIVDNPLTCGLAYGGKPVAREWAFSVVNVMCMVGYYSFVHEIAHTLGAMHDRNTHNCGRGKCCSGNCSNFGYQDPKGRFRSIMAYSCPDSKNCPRVQYFSQPDHEYVPDEDEPQVSHPIGSATENNADQIMKAWDEASRNLPTKFVSHPVPSPTTSPTGAPTPDDDPCGDGVCDGDDGEDCKTCPEDCIGGIFEEAECGNGWCEDGETCLTCPPDCASRRDTSLRGNFCCEGGPVEPLIKRRTNEVSCTNSYCNFNIQCDLTDRSGNPSYCCGNGICELGESVVTCPTDCKCDNNGICEIFEDATCPDCQDMEQNLTCLGVGRACVGIRPVPCCGTCVDKKCVATE